MLIILCVLAACLAGAVFAYPDNVGYAQNAYSFIISTNDGVNWELSEGNGTLIVSSRGNFYDNVGVEFSERINSMIGQSDYSLQFLLPSIDAFFIDGINSNPYTQNDDSLIIVDCTHTAILGGGISRMLEYRVRGASEYKTYASAMSEGSSIRFGKDVDNGEYELRYVITEELIFNDKLYSVRRESANELACTITTAVPVLPQLGVQLIPYGTPVSQIGALIDDDNATWTLSDGQTDTNLILPVSDSPYKIRFDYKHNNKNYDVVKNVEVDIMIVPKHIRVYIRDVKRLCAQPEVDDFVYVLGEALIGDDTQEQLNFSFEVEDLDINTAGEYKIIGHWDNANYSVEFLNYDSPIIDYGRYIVYPTHISVTAWDGRAFDFYCASGFINASPVLDKAQDFSVESPKGYELLGAYSLAYVDVAGDIVDFDNEVEISLKFDGASKIVYFLDDEFVTVDVNEQNSFVLPSGVSQFYLFELSDETARLYWYEIFIIVLISLLAVGIAVTAIIFKKRRWLLV